MHKYEIIIYWSNEDAAFVAEVPELPGCAAHGDTQRAALDNVNQAVELWIETAREFGDAVPEPKGARLMLRDHSYNAAIMQVTLVALFCGHRFGGKETESVLGSRLFQEV